MSVVREDRRTATIDQSMLQLIFERVSRAALPCAEGHISDYVS